MGIMVFSMIVLLTLLVTALAIFVFLARWPGQTAAARNHPYADAVTVAGWVGLLAGGVLWPLALVWAYLTPPAEPLSGDGQ
ncbi:DUF3302 domain-containing protein [Halieaceae bacterium IMCC14734]|uniref:DUF3302 domain-containing protein n=1 Tax=Candidatus Litorirhabdus singularis TaxID=2518993 RepID=A0ABT3TD45_9GAMM|nr:DUF3302 domain-containing protein [Candidatus Litorirhabdus singularis]MCX2980193.1 DUF3302 domain-containing protein [Candidatus Litorirhabdus singularis]